MVRNRWSPPSREPSRRWYVFADDLGYSNVDTLFEERLRWT